jgi:hypothetical protein
MNFAQIYKQLEKYADYARCNRDNSVASTIAWNTLQLFLALMKYFENINFDTAGLVPKTTKVNGKPLSSDITLDSTDIGLSNVKNVDTTTTANITDTTNKRFLSDSQKILLQTGVVSQSTTVNGIPLTGNITLRPIDLGLEGLDAFKNLTPNELPVSSATQLALNNKANTNQVVPITRTINGVPLSNNIVLDKDSLGLSNVSNIAPIDYPVSTAQQSALNGKENTSNKSNDENLGNSTSLYPTQRAVKVYVDNVNDTMQEYVNDNLSDVRQEIEDRIAEVVAGEPMIPEPTFSNEEFAI